MVKLLLERGAVLRDSDGTNAIVINAQDGISRTLRSVLYEGQIPDLESLGRLTAVIASSQNGRLEVIRLLIKPGPNTDLVAGALKKTAFVRAANSGHIEPVKLLLKNDANFDIDRTFRFTSLMVAALNGHSDIVKIGRASCRERV